jgi:hypothetical protein
MNVARIMQGPARVGTLPVAICNEAMAMTKDVFVAAGGMWTLVSRVMAEASTWPTEHAYAATATDYVKYARRVIDALRAAAEDERDVFADPLASGWDDVVRRPRATGAISSLRSSPLEEGLRPSASSA